MDSPAGAQIIAAREAVQVSLGLHKTAAVDWCAGIVHVSRRTWQSWEYADRSMPQGLWELLIIKLAAHKVVDVSAGA